MHKNLLIIDPARVDTVLSYKASYQERPRGRKFTYNNPNKERHPIFERIGVKPVMRVVHRPAYVRCHSSSFYLENEVNYCRRCGNGYNRQGSLVSRLFFLRRWLRILLTTWL